LDAREFKTKRSHFFLICTSLEQCKKKKKKKLQLLITTGELVLLHTYVTAEPNGQPKRAHVLRAAARGAYELARHTQSFGTRHFEEKNEENNKSFMNTFATLCVAGVAEAHQTVSAAACNDHSLHGFTPAIVAVYCAHTSRLSLCCARCSIVGGWRRTVIDIACSIVKT
jgi:hypothetical protein